MRWRRGLKLRAQWWLIAIITSLLVTALTVDHTLQRFDNVLYDHLLQIGSPPASQSVLLVDIDEASLHRLGRWPWSRETHAALIDRLNAGKPAAIAYDVLFTEPGDPQEDARLAQAIGAGAPVFVPMLPGGPQSAAILPIETVRRAAAGVGYATIEPDADGVVRSATTHEGGARHLMALTARSTGAGHHARLIPFGGGAGRWPEVSAAAVLAGEVPAELLRNRIVLVGATAPGLGSRYPTPAGAVMSGAEINAYLLQGLRSGMMIDRAGLALCLILGLLPLWLLMLALGPWRRLPALANFALCCALVLGLSVLALTGLRVWLPPGAALAGLAVAYPVWGWRQLAVVEQFMRVQLERLDEEPSLLLRASDRGRPGGAAYTITLLRAAIARNREMRHFVADRLDQLPDATLVSDLSGRVVLANVAARGLFAGLEQKADAGADTRVLLKAFRLTQNGEDVPFPPPGCEAVTHEVQIDPTRFFLVGIAPQTSAQGHYAGWVIRFVDISEAKAAQRHRDDVVQLLTHDMRSPQASILAVLETATPARIPERESAVIRQYAERTLQLADGFVQLARAENLEYALEEVDLGDMLMDAIDDLWPQSRAKRIDIVTSGTERLVVTVERSLITRALVNLIGNAIKYSPEDTTITCALAGEQGEDGTFWATCSIADQGPGMAPELLLTIFERFRRGSAVKDWRTSGAGLGLSFVQTVMGRHRGEIRCESAPGRGATFILRLPAST